MLLLLQIRGKWAWQQFYVTAEEKVEEEEEGQVREHEAKRSNG